MSPRQLNTSFKLEHEDLDVQLVEKKMKTIISRSLGEIRASWRCVETC